MKISCYLAIVALLAVEGGVAAGPDSPTIEVTRLTDRLHLLTTDQGSYTTNSIAFVGEDGVLLVDTQSEDDAAAFRQVVDDFGKGTPKYIINTHRHVEHVGGNAVFGDDPVVIAHELVPSRLRSGSYIFNEFPKATFPDITVSESLALHFNGESVRVISFAGSHDDNEVIVHFTESGVVHLSSLVNGFNFPSVDSAGDVMKFAELVAKAIELLPEDVAIVSGHNGVGSWNDLRAYHEMLVRTTEIVRTGLADGKDLATLQEQNILSAWESYAGSYVSVNDWIEYLVDGLGPKEDPKETVFEPLYHLWKEKGATHAVEHYQQLKRNRPDAYRFDELTLLVIGDKLLKKDKAGDAATFIAASLQEYPDSRYNYYANYKLAMAHVSLGDKETAAVHCRAALELDPEFQAAIRLLEELGTP